MLTGDLAIPVAFLILAALLLWLIIDVRGKWWLKALLMVLVVLYSAMVWESLDSYLGWPTRAALPKKAILLWGVVIEPNSKIGDPGAVYLWLKPIEMPSRETFLGYSPNHNDPRAYRLPYSRELHKDASRAVEGVRNGKYIIVEFGAMGDNNVKGPGGGRSSALSGGDKYSGGGLGSGNAPGSIKFYMLPPPKYPPKIKP